MAVTIQAGSISSWAGMLNSTAPFGHNLPVTVASGTNSVLFVLVGDATPELTATFNGVAMTLADAQGSGSAALSTMFYMVNPPVGTFNVSANDIGWQARSITVTAFVLDNVDQTTPHGSVHNHTNPYPASPATSTLTSASDGALISILSLYSTSAPAITPQAGNTTLSDQLNATGSLYSRAGYTIGAATSIGWTYGGTSQQVGLLSYVITPAAGGNAAPTFIGPNIGNQTGTVGTPLSSYTVSDSFSDGDALTFSAIGSWPPGITVSSAGIISGTPTTAGTYETLKVRATDTAANTVDSDTFSFTIAAVAVDGTITIPAVRDWGTGNLKVAQTGVQVDVLSVASGNLVVRKTGQTTHATTANLVVTDAAIVAGTLYGVIDRYPDGSKGYWEYTAT